MEDVVDADHLAASISVHKSAATLFKSVNHISEHGVIDVRVGDVVEVTANDTRELTVSHLVSHLCSLSGSNYHT